MISLHRRHFLSTAAIGSAMILGARPGQAQTRNVMDTLAADGRFSRFIDIITQAGVTDQLRSTASVTVFAPVNQAFDVVNARMTELTSQGSGNINQNSTDPLRLRALIAYHIVAGSMPSSGLLNDRRFKTVNGAELLVANDGSKIAVSNPAPEQQTGSFGAGGLNVQAPALVVGPDIIANNGIIHAISQVLFP
ncbi:Uncaracterized surface protein containing fasciclin (FAS1) repeats [Belnapia rosea]|uniref:Uncaracterized surface protein containing fasciclin (FAS1) repeats n=2 Tax=Belnapia rosea TaxID=938405 RepID=A0A1G6TQS1_9PROT|nr:Uncaracterized surface protein containing fasciclin (FAS1) repeats [Belnapia rosea]SDD30675.1 Uncaracterized surface protein containing fasciclin (FAS1) repeats [Belnapia rosea]